MKKISLLVSSAIISSGMMVGTAYAQQAPATGASATGEIIVTARKRQETSIEVPVVLTAVSGVELERRAISNLDGLTRLVPQLQLGSGGGTVQGGHVGIRGISGSDSNPFADQAVSFNIDGVQISRSNIRRMAEMDTAQVEVLKGPQALFFGKNSPAGIISIRSADPTSSFAAKLSAGYEFKAREFRNEGFISGPISDTLGVRVAGYRTSMSGWFKNDYPKGTQFSPNSDRLPKTKEFALRGTLKWDPTDRFSARLKGTFNKMSDAGTLTVQEYLYCPLGTPQLGGGSNCKLDGQGGRGNLGTYLGTIAPGFKDGRPYVRMKQALGSLEMNYDITDDLALTSVSGLYYLDQEIADTFNYSGNPALHLPSAGHFGNKEFSQELRLASSFDGPVNLLFGGFYQKARAFTRQYTFIGVEPNPVTGANPTQLNNYRLKQKGEAYSVFGQITVKPTEQLEISAGGRYSHEKKSLPLIENMTGPAGPGWIPRAELPENPLYPRKDSWNNFSPEVTVSYRPNTDLNIFASYKRGFLSGGFNSGATNFNSDLRFNQQNIKGFEGGVKASLLDHALRTNLSAYRYVVTGMQITTSQAVNNVPVQTVLNAGKATFKGVEFDFNYRTPLQGLLLYGAAGYNNAKYNIFSGGCYVGQSQAAGCDYGAINPATGRYALQNLAGRQVLRAPKWSGSLGLGYEGEIGSSLKWGFNGDMMFSSGYDTNPTASPFARQKAYQLFDANLRVGAQDDLWELALIGRNLTNKFYLNRTVDTPLTGAGSTTGSVLGGLLADTSGAVNRGREIMLRATFRFGQ